MQNSIRIQFWNNYKNNSGIWLPCSFFGHLGQCLIFQYAVRQLINKNNYNYKKIQENMSIKNLYILNIIDMLVLKV